MVLGFSEKNHNFTVHRFYLQKKRSNNDSFSSSHVSFFFISTIKLFPFYALRSYFCSFSIVGKNKPSRAIVLDFAIVLDVFLGQVDVLLDCFLLSLKGLQLFLRCFDVSQKRPEARAC